MINIQNLNTRNNTVDAVGTHMDQQRQFEVMHIGFSGPIWFVRGMAEEGMGVVRWLLLKHEDL